MKLSKNLINEFVKMTNDRTKESPETTVYGNIVKNGDRVYVQLDGSDILTPVSTTTDTQPGDRVVALIKNHTATVTGNMTSPAARTSDVQEINERKLDESSADLKYATIANLEATNASINNLEATHASFETITAGRFKGVSASLENLEATHSEFETLTAEKFEAVDAKINSIVVGDLEVVYANIDFSNIGKAAMEHFYSASGLIENVVVSDGTITGNLVGVTIKGDLIEGNTVVADKLVIKGEDGLYCKLNTDGVKIEAEQTEYNSLNGSIITTKSITATKISVDDLVAFDATIGGFNITSDSLYSGVKESIENTTPGIYLRNDGQISLGDSTNFLKYYKDDEGNFKLDVSLGGANVESVTEGTSGIWSYRKWSNGRVELFGSYTVSEVSCSNQFGSAMYRSDALTIASFPFSIYEPNLTASYESNGYGAFLWATSTTTETSPPTYYLVRAESGTINSGKINFHVIGKWTE